MKVAPLVVVLLLGAIAPAQSSSQRSKGPLVFITGNGEITINSSGFAVFGVAAGSAASSKHDQTIEMAQQLMKNCPEITLTLKTADPVPDYDLVLNRQSVGMFNEGVSQFMLVRSSDQIVLYASKQGTVAKAMRDGCRALLADWRQQHPEPARGDYWQKAEPSK